LLDVHTWDWQRAKRVTGIPLLRLLFLRTVPPPATSANALVRCCPDPPRSRASKQQLSIKRCGCAVPCNAGRSISLAIDGSRDPPRRRHIILKQPPSGKRKSYTAPGPFPCLSCYYFPMASSAGLGSTKPHQDVSLHMSFAYIYFAILFSPKPFDQRRWRTKWHVSTTNSQFPSDDTAHARIMGSSTMGGG
jgi:hypothetical protein